MSAADKAFRTIAAVAAQLGMPVWRTDPADGCVRYFAVWGGAVTLLPDVAALDTFVQAAGRAQLVGAAR